MASFGRKARIGAMAAAAGAALSLTGTGVATTQMSERAARESLAPTGDPVIVVGHRGTMKFAPENTLAAFDKAIELGARAVEMDVRTTADGEFVIMHDPLVNRTTDGSGLVSSLTLSEIKQLDAGSWFSPDFAGERVPTLREALRHLNRRAAVDIDFKAGPRDSAERIARILDEEGYRDGRLVTVFVRAGAYERMKPLPERYFLRPHYLNERKTALAAEDGVKIMGLRRRDFSFMASRDIADNNLMLFANVMGKDDNAVGYSDALRAGARFIQTDHLDRLVPYLKARGVLLNCVPAADLSCQQPASENVRLAAAGAAGR
jgi:glycerophosphoryl diester phosphodiesterase